MAVGNEIGVGVNRNRNATHFDNLKRLAGLATFGFGRAVFIETLSRLVPFSERGGGGSSRRSDVLTRPIYGRKKIYTKGRYPTVQASMYYPFFVQTRFSHLDLIKGRNKSLFHLTAGN